MDRYIISDIIVEINDFIRSDDGDGDNLKEKKANKLAKVAQFMGAAKVEFFDGKDERYIFHKPNGKLELDAGHHYMPSAGFINFEVK